MNKVITMKQVQNHIDKSSSPASQVVYTKYELFRICLKVFVFFLRVLVAYFENFLTFMVELVNPKKPKNIAGQLALVTGGAKGLGREIARSLARQKCNIVICGQDLESGIAVAKEIEEEFGVRVKAYKCDIADHNQIKELKENIEADVGFVDILVNNAGILPLMSLREGKYTDYQRIINVNTLGCFWVTLFNTCNTFTQQYSFI